MRWRFEAVGHLAHATARLLKTQPDLREREEGERIDEASRPLIKQVPALVCRCFTAIAKAFAPASQERVTSLCSCKEKLTKRNTAGMRAGAMKLQRFPALLADRGGAELAALRHPRLLSPIRCGARLALRLGKSKTGSHSHSHSHSHSNGNGNGNGQKVMPNDCCQKRRSSGSCFCFSEFPSAATEPAGKTRRATCMDAHRFSTRQGCRVEKSCWRSGPGARSARGAEAGRAFFGPPFFARAKKGGSLLRSRSESSCITKRGCDKCAWA